MFIRIGERYRYDSLYKLVQINTIKIIIWKRAAVSGLEAACLFLLVNLIIQGIFSRESIDFWIPFNKKNFKHFKYLVILISKNYGNFFWLDQKNSFSETVKFRLVRKTAHAKLKISLGFAKEIENFDLMNHRVWFTMAYECEPLTYIVASLWLYGEFFGEQSPWVAYALSSHVWR